MTLTNNHYEMLFYRHPRNPILTAADWPYPANSVFNAGATRLQDGLPAPGRGPAVTLIWARLVLRTASTVGKLTPNLP
jgi:hypothetical protein